MAAVAIATALLGSCSSDGSSADPRVARSPSPAASQAFISGYPCPPLHDLHLPSDAGCASRVVGDGDGDGERETLTVFAVLDRDDIPVRWYTYLSDSGATQRLHAGARFSYPRAVGAADVDGDGHDEWFVKIADLASHGTNWRRLGFFVERDGRLVAVTEKGEPFAFNIGGTSRLGEGFSCEGSGFALLRAEAKNVANTRWRYAERSYAMVGRRVRFQARRVGLLRLVDYNDPALDRFYELRCNELRAS